MTVGFQAVLLSVGEGVGLVTLCVVLTGALGRVAVVTIETQDNTAQGTVRNMYIARAHKVCMYMCLHAFTCMYMYVPSYTCIGPNKLSVCSFELNYVTCTFML